MTTSGLRLWAPPAFPPPEPGFKYRSAVPMNPSSETNVSRPRAVVGPRPRRAALFVATLLTGLAAGWLPLTLWAPRTEAQAYRVRVKVQLPAVAELPRALDQIRTELLLPAALTDALAAAGIDAHEAAAGLADSIRNQLEIETRTADVGFDLVVSLPQVARLDAPAAAIVVNRLIESWLAQHQRTQADAAQKAYDTAQAKLEQAHQQLVAAGTEYNALVDQMLSGAGSPLARTPGEALPSKPRPRCARTSNVAWPNCAQRAVLLESRTGEHPDVIASGEELALLESRLRELQAEALGDASGGSAAASLRDQLNFLRRDWKTCRSECDRLSIASAPPTTT